MPNQKEKRKTMTQDDLYQHMKSRAKIYIIANDMIYCAEIKGVSNKGVSLIDNWNKEIWRMFSECYLEIAEAIEENEKQLFNWYEKNYMVDKISSVEMKNWLNINKEQLLAFLKQNKKLKEK